MRKMRLSRPLALLVAAAAVSAGLLFGLGGAASAATVSAATTSATSTAVTHPAPLSAQAAQALVQRAVANHTVATPQATRATSVSPNLACAYYYDVCGEGANDNSFAYTTCNVIYELPNLVGDGPLINNQTTNTVAYFFNENEDLLFTSTAYDNRTVDWTPVWYVLACQT